MHANNPFLESYDFEALTQHHPSLKQFVFVNKYGAETIRFANQKAVKALNAALLKMQYKILWEIPNENLCPPIPGRLDYLLHIDELVAKKKIHLLDIGAGANLIYPILAVCHFKWSCTASETNMKSLRHAEEIIKKNPTLSAVVLRAQKNEKSILENIILPDDFFDVVVCNPPFYKSAEDAQKQNQRKVKNLKIRATTPLNFGGLSNELWTEGGEVFFLKKMILESTKFKNQVHWFTSLVSKREHIKSLLHTMKKTKPKHYKVIDLDLGNKSSRVIAWTFT
ncbi:MAG: 23S rRNA (adenine(1618)-N(6))-methyltransferase RlmF [Crocinitomicaceae bacterium]